MSLRSIKPWNRKSTLAKMRYVLQQLEEEIKSSPGEHTWVLENSTKSWLCTASWHLTGRTWTLSACNFPPTLPAFQCASSATASMDFDMRKLEHSFELHWTQLHLVISDSCWWCNSELGGREFMTDSSVAAGAANWSGAVVLQVLCSRKELAIWTQCCTN